jgi:S1-C subfamily serine protease
MMETVLIRDTDDRSLSGVLARMGKMRTGVVLGVIAITAVAGCRHAGRSGPPTEAPSPVSFASALPGPHIIGHKPGTCDLCDLYYKARTHVVRLRAGDGMGTGFVVSESGQIVTNAHVVGNDDAPSVETFEGAMFAARTLRRSVDVDLALVQADPPSGGWVPLQVEPVALPEVGSDVYVIGHPVGMGWTITRGIVSAVRRAGEIAPIEMIQTDAAISPGNSGGPLLNRHGQLVGVVVSKLAGPGIESVGFAIPVSEAAAFIAQGERAGSSVKTGVGASFR